jgi:23S rRNA (guanosine2251-2'-O)-methyltransferase
MKIYKRASEKILNADQLRKGEHLELDLESIRRNEIYIILDNVLDTYNIGSVFRLADAAAVRKIYLCGGSETPPNHRIKKASINTTEVVPWEYSESTEELIKDLKSSIPNLQVVAIEQSENSVSYTGFNYKLPIALVVGHETHGVSRRVLDLCDAVVEIPMYGLNISLNVMVSLAIVLYKVLEKNVE